MPGSRKWGLPLAVVGCLVVATMSSHGRPPVPAADPATASVSSFTLLGAADNACLTSLRACLEALPGVERLALDTKSIAVTRKPGAAAIDELVIAAVRSSGHSVAGRNDPDPDFPPLAADAVAALDTIESEWIVVRLGPARCAECARLTADRLRDVKGVRNAYRLEPRPGIAVQRDPASCPVSRIAEAARASIRGTVEVEATHALAVEIAGMQCHKCIAAVSFALGRAPFIIRFDVQVGRAKIVALASADSSRVVHVIDNAPPPT